MALTDGFLYALARRWPDRMDSYYGDPRLDRGEPGSAAYALAYAEFQFNNKVKSGLGAAVWDRDVLELGCGHGGISCFMAVAGARSVTGIDISAGSLATAARFLAALESRVAASRLPVRFLEMPAETTTFDALSFDLVVADNLIEHVADPLTVMREAHRVLRPGGTLLVPSFPSIFSRDGLHLKYGLNIPWANIVFTDRTIIRTLRRIAERDPRMYEFYPGLQGECREIRDVRRYRDLNGITHRRFRQCALAAGFRIERFTVSTWGYSGKLLSKVPGLRDSRLGDVLSVGASAVLRKEA